MSTISELSEAVRTRREDMGLTQTLLARLSGLSRATVNQLERGAVQDLSVERASRLLEVLGLSLHVSEPCSEPPPGGRSPALTIAARTASVSFQKSVSADQLRTAFTKGKAGEAIWPHLHTLLDEAPVSLLARVVEQLHQESGLERGEIWQHMRLLAGQLQCSRQLWS